MRRKDRWTSYRPKPYLRSIGTDLARVCKPRRRRTVFPQDLPTGIRLAVQQAECSEPVMARQKRWEAGNIHYPSLIKEGDRYRLWYCCFADPEDPWVKAGHVPGKVPGLWCYAESSDGFHWERPELGRVEYAGSKDNNILFVCDQVGSSYGYMNVMRDPNGSDEERYKAIGITAKFEVDGQPASRAEVMELRAKREAAGDAGEIGANITSQVVVTAGVSADGYSWTHLPEPIMAPPFLLDTQNILTYDADSGKYVIYLRSGRERRRAVSRYEADTFRGPWDNHLMVLTAEPDDPPDWDIYAPGYCRHPHGQHLMFFSPYRRASDLVDVYLATSHDGQLWYRPERKPIIPVSERYGSLYPTPELVELDQDHWGVLTLACPHPHNRTSDQSARVHLGHVEARSAGGLGSGRLGGICPERTAMRRPAAQDQLQDLVAGCLCRSGNRRWQFAQSNGRVFSPRPRRVQFCRLRPDVWGRVGGCGELAGQVGSVGAEGAEDPFAISHGAHPALCRYPLIGDRVCWWELSP